MQADSSAQPAEVGSAPQQQPTNTDFAPLPPAESTSIVYEYTLAEDVVAMPVGFLKPFVACFTPWEARELRAVCKDLARHVAAQSFDDLETSVTNLPRWRASFPRALGVSIRNWRRSRRQMTDEERSSLIGIRRLDVHFCEGLIDADFAAFGASLQVLLATEARWLSGSLLQFTPNLRVLKLRSSGGRCNWDDDAFSSVSLPALEELELSWMHPSTATFGGLGKNAPRLTHLTLEHVPLCPDWFTHLPGLKTLKISFSSTEPRSRAEGTPDALLQPLVALQDLDISGCPYLTDAAFAPWLPGNDSSRSRLRRVNISFCKQFTDATLAALAGVEELAMARCTQATLTDAGFAHLAGIKNLDMSFCDQKSITAAAFASIRGVETLNVSGCREALTAAHFVALGGRSGLVELDVSYNHTLPGNWLVPLRGLKRLKAEFCHKLSDEACFALGGAGGLEVANLDQCDGVSDAGIAALAGVKELSVAFLPLSDAAFAPHAGRLRKLCIKHCRTLTDAAFVHFSGIRELDMSHCNQTTITDAAFKHLRGIWSLCINGCDQATITDAALAHLSGIGHFSACWRGAADFSDAARRSFRAVFGEL